MRVRPQVVIGLIGLKYFFEDDYDKLKMQMECMKTGMEDMKMNMECMKREFAQMDPRHDRKMIVLYLITINDTLYYL